MNNLKLTKIVCIFIFSLFFYSCNDQTCINYVNNTFRVKRYSFIVEKKRQEGRHNIIEGKGNSGIYEIFKEPGFDDLYHNVDIGDSIKKESGKVNVKLIKKDEVQDFPCYCNGKIVE